MRILNQFESIYVINMDSRPDRLESFMIRMSTIGHDRISRFPAIVPSDENGAKGCVMSHVSILKKAREMNLANVLVFEDDAMPTGYACDFSLPDKWDIIYLGYNSHIPLNLVEDNFLRMEMCYSTHAIAYNRSMYDVIISAFESGSIDIIDVWLSRNIQPRFMCLGTYPILFTQEPGYSDIANESVDYEFIMKRFEENTKHLTKPYAERILRMEDWRHLR